METHLISIVVMFSLPVTIMCCCVILYVLLLLGIVACNVVGWMDDVCNDVVGSPCNVQYVIVVKTNKQTN